MEIQLWKDILNPYELAVEELLVKFNHLIKEYQDRVCTRRWSRSAAESNRSPVF